MKKIVKLIVTFLSLFIIVNVNALNIGDKFTLSPGASQTHSAIYGLNENYQLHTVSSGGKTYDAYCMDRGKAAGQGASYEVHRMMPKLKGDYAVLYLMKNGADKEQIHLAIRLLVSKGMLNWSDGGTADYLAKIDAAVNCMKSDSTFKSTLTEFLSKSSKKNTDEGGKSLALLGFDEFNLLQSETGGDGTGRSGKIDSDSNGSKSETGGGTGRSGKIDSDSNGSKSETGGDGTGRSGKIDSDSNGSKSETGGDGTGRSGKIGSNDDDSNCNTLDKQKASFDKCQREVADNEKREFYQKSYICEYNKSTKCFYAIENTSADSNNSKNCNTIDKQKASFDKCQREVADKEKREFYQKSYICEYNKSTKCFYVTEVKKSSNNNSNKTNNGNTDGNAGSGGASSGNASVSCGGFDSIKQLLIDAMNYANEKFNDDAEETKVQKGPASDPIKADGIIKKIVSVKIDIKNIADPSSSSEYFKYLGYEVNKENADTEIELLGISNSFSKNEDDWEDISEGEDLSQWLENRNGTLYVGFLISRPIKDSQETTDDYEEEDCAVDIKFKYEYSIDVGGAVLYGSDYTNQQRFFISTEGEPVKDEFDLNTSLCEEITCDPTSTLPNICEDGSNADENGNVEYEFREAYNSESGKYNIKKCLLTKNSTDKAGNSYTLEDDENASMVNDNPYCEVKCKEDYKFGVPYKRNAEAGRYFQISVALKGTQDCYTTKLDYKKYTEDVVKKQAEIIDAYNDWLENYENYTFPLVQGEGVDCSAVDCPYDVDPKTGKTKNTCSPKEKENAEYLKTIIHSYDFYNYEIIEGTDRWTISANTGLTKIGPKFGKWLNNATCTPSCDVSNPCKWEMTPDDHYKSLIKEYEAGIASAKSKLKELIEQLREIVDTYNSCAADHDYASKQTDKSKTYGNTAYWDMIYNYNPEIVYSYDEPEPGISSVNWINEVSGKTCEHGMTCDNMYSTDAIVNAEKCANTSDNKVKCEKSASVNDIDGNSHVVTWYCDGEIDNEYGTCKGSATLDYNDEYHWMVEDADLNTGADYRISIGTNKSNSLHKITKVDYVRKTASSKGTYNTERVYYSMHDDGTISIKETPEMKIENADIVDGLPVSINTPTGTYYYKLTLNNIGSFYSEKDSLGRIFGTGKSLSNEVRSEAVAKGNKAQVGKNEYACTYEVNQNTCEDSQGNKHYKTECEKGENWEKCQERLCPVSPKGPFCVEKSQSYYVCNNTTYDSSCKAKNSREEALAAVGCKVGEACEQNFNCCPNCKVECIGQCSITNNGSKKPEYDFRPVSPGNLFPTDRDIGYNWESNPDKYHNSLVARKAGDTITEITKRANDVSSENGSTDTTVEDYTLKVTMNADMISKIKAYNKEQKSYNNETMNCMDYPINITSEATCKEKGYTWQENKCILSNIFCTSSFIDQLINGDFGGSVNMKSLEGRTADIEKFTTYTSPYGVSNSDNLITTNDYWTIYRFSTLDVNGDGIPDVGPSWK